MKLFTISISWWKWVLVGAVLATIFYASASKSPTKPPTPPEPIKDDSERFSYS